MRRTIALLGLPLLMAVGCAPADSAPARPSSGSPDQRREAFDQRAAEVAARWRPGPAWTTGYVPLQEGTVLTGDPGFTPDTETAFRAGWYRDQIPLPAAKPGDGSIQFPDGTLRVPLVSAAEAYAQLDQGDPPPCDGRPKEPGSTGGPGRPKDGGPTIEPGPDGPVSSPVQTACIPLTVIAVKLGTASVRTSRGVAEVPAWLFTVDELKTPVARVAVAPSAVAAVPPGDGPTGPVPDGVVGAESLDAADGTRLDYRLAVGACDTAITPRVLERDDVVVVGGSVTRSTGVCTLQLVLKPVTVTLKAPLGTRPVLNVSSGAPLTCTAARLTGSAVPRC
ncbi:hypothetical protein DLJ46_13305 [Micromonospora globispora]|uniref:Uncharacterized protein n=1 Tax=Micromonospora globispora TaxID=1450148 RepID=A0A317K6E2_9ACTN|nr:hypothetical protein [Micromonospora globispora]PWU47918.1 hypothetical protein DLJ46_13305 [Micromonospora globispora]